MVDHLRKPDIERLLAAMRREKPDRVPHFEDVIDPAMTSHILGRPSPYASVAVSPRDALHITRSTCQDAITIVIGPSMLPGTIQSEADLDAWRPPGKDEIRDRVRPYCDALAGTGIGMNAIVWGPFMIAYLGMGPTPIQDFLLRIYEDPAFAERMLDRSLDAQLAALDAVMDLPIDIIEIADDTCDTKGYMCSEKIMEAVWIPRIERLVAAVRQKGVPIQWHCCGKIDRLLPRLIDWGIDLIGPLQTRCNDIFAIKEQYGDRIAIRGNLNIEGVLAFGTPDEVRSATCELVQRLAPGGGYIAGSSHSIVDSIPPANYFAMIDAIIEFGQY